MNRISNGLQKIAKPTNGRSPQIKVKEDLITIVNLQVQSADAAYLLKEKPNDEWPQTMTKMMLTAATA